MPPKRHQSYYNITITKSFVHFLRKIHTKQKLIQCDNNLVMATGRGGGLPHLPSHLFFYYFIFYFFFSRDGDALVLFQLHSGQGKFSFLDDNKAMFTIDLRAQLLIIKQSTSIHMFDKFKRKQINNNNNNNLIMKDLYHLTTDFEK